MKKILSLVLVVSVILSLMPCMMVEAENSFVDIYNYEDLLDAEIEYDLNFDGTKDSLKMNLYANYWAYWSFEINNKQILHNITRHGSYEKIYITDIDTNDNYLDIILINRYKGLSADIFRFNGRDLLKSTDFYIVSNDRGATTYDMDVSIIAGNSDIMFIYGNERFEYKNVGSFEKVNLGNNYEGVFNAYKDMLIKTEFSKYTLYDIDRDRIPELILSNDSEGFSDCEIYTYTENKFTKIAEDTIHYGLYSSGWGGVLFETGGTGVVSFIQKNIENGKLIESSNTFLSACYVPGYENFIFQGEEVSENEYNIQKPTENDRLQFVQKNDLGILRKMLFQNEKEIKVVLNGEEIKFDQPPIMAEDRILVPIRKIAEAMGDTVLWNDEYQTAFIKHEDRGLIIKLLEDHIKIVKNEQWNQWEEKALDVMAFSLNGRTLVPVRAFCESLGADVNWNGDEYTAYITYDFNKETDEMSSETFKNINTVYYALNNDDVSFDAYSDDFNYFYNNRNRQKDAVKMGVSDIWAGVNDLLSGLSNSENIMKNSFEQMLAVIPDNGIVSVDKELFDDLKDFADSGKYVFDEINGIDDEFLELHPKLKTLDTSIEAVGTAYDIVSFSTEQIAVFLSNYETNISYIEQLRSILQENNLLDDSLNTSLIVLQQEYSDKFFNVMLNTRDELEKFTITEGSNLATGGLFSVGVFTWEQLFSLSGITDDGQALKTFYGLYCINGVLDRAYNRTNDKILNGAYTSSDVENLKILDDLQRALKIKTYQCIKTISKDSDTHSMCDEYIEALKKSCILWKP